MKTNNEIKRLGTSHYILFKDFLYGGTAYVLDATNLDVSEEELQLCINAQIYNLE